MHNLKTSVIAKYFKTTSKLNDVGKTYLESAKDRETAQDNLFKVYQSYSLFATILSYAVLILGIFLVLKFKNYTGVLLMPLALVIPFSFRWSMSQVLNISSHEYYEWRKKRDQKQ